MKTDKNLNNRINDEVGRLDSRITEDRRALDERINRKSQRFR